MSGKRKAATQRVKRTVCKKSDYWTDQELLKLAAALQFYGSSETKLIADAMQTKSECAVKEFLSNGIDKLRRKSNQQYRKSERKNGNKQWLRPTPDQLNNWPQSRLWRRVIFDQLLPCVKRNDYSKLFMEDLLETFYNEAEEVNNPRVINVKRVYKYLLDCVRGNVPAELSPIDSGLLIVLFSQIQEMLTNLDFEEEEKFIRTFKKAKNFVPIKLKEEFSERSRKRCESQNLDCTARSESQDEENNEEEQDSIKVVEEMYINLTKHRKLVQSLNPLNVPIWTLVKEQGYLRNMFNPAPREVFHHNKDAVVPEF